MWASANQDLWLGYLWYSCYLWRWNGETSRKKDNSKGTPLTGMLFCAIYCARFYYITLLIKYFSSSSPFLHVRTLKLRDVKYFVPGPQVVTSICRILSIVPSAGRRGFWGWSGQEGLLCVLGSVVRRWPLLEHRAFEHEKGEIIFLATRDLFSHFGEESI